MTQIQHPAKSVNSCPKDRRDKPSGKGGAAVRPAGGTGPKGRKILAAPFLYQNSNNCTENENNLPLSPLETVLSRLNQFAPYHQKQAFCIKKNCEAFIKSVGFNRVGFLTLTFADNVTDNKEASRRYKSLSNHFLPKNYGSWMLVKERQSRGAWHYHILIDCLADIRTGFDFGLHSEISTLRDSKNGGWKKNKVAIRALEKKYFLASPLPLRRLWAINSNVQKYGFGRPDLYPLEKIEDAVAAYMSKYLSKHVEARREEDKGIRLTSYSKDFLVKSSTKFAWDSKGGREWRRKVAKFAGIVGVTEDDGLTVKYGPRWSYHLGTLIDCIDGLSPSSVPDMARSMMRHAMPWSPSDQNVKRQDHINETVLDDGLLYLKAPDFRKTGQVYGPLF